MEASLKRVEAILMTPHQFIGEIATAKSNIQYSIDRAIALLRTRLVGGELHDHVLAWISEVEEAKNERNSLVHAEWSDLAITFRVTIKKQRLIHDPEDIHPDSLRDLARKMFGLHEEGRYVRLDLMRAGFGGVTTVSDVGVSRAEPSAELQLGPGALSPRPARQRLWPGETFFQSLA